MAKDEYFEIIIGELDDAIRFLSQVVDDVGNTIGIYLPQTHANFRHGVHHDYVYFCVTKSLRSSSAMLELVKMGFREDCMIIARSIYETYLLLSNSLKNPDFIDVVVFQSLKLSKGIMKPQKDHNMVRDVNSGEIFSHDLRKAKLARNTLHESDGKIHHFIYKFMSEIIHSDFLSSGNYRTIDNKKYVVVTGLKHINELFFLTYFIYLICEHMQFYHANFDFINKTDLHIQDVIEFQNVEMNLSSILIEMIGIIKFTDNDSKFKDLLRKRITKNVLFPGLNPVQD